MKVTWLPDVAPRERRVAVGEFDGVHLGHRAVIADADTVLTFEPHPRAVVAADAAPKLLTPLPVKVDLLAELAVAELVVIPFDAAFAEQTPQAFADEVLVRALAAREVRVGENFRFGHRAQGDASFLERQVAFTTTVADMVEVDGEIVSSTHIRGLVAAGEVERAGRLLGAPFNLRGVVQHGDERGRTLGYPTANLVPENRLCYPGHGIYACQAGLPADGGWQWWPAAVSIGVRPTFSTGRGVLVEAYLIGYEGDCYGQELRLEVLRRIRGEKRFDSVEALVEQMAADTREALRAAG